MKETAANHGPNSVNVLVVGCGNIGSRLLQSLANVAPNSTGQLNIYGLEPYESARNTSLERFDSINTAGHRLTLQEDWAGIPEDIDLLIVSVDARNRLNALSEALKRCRVKYAVLEKTLFLKESEFGEARELLSNGGVKTWVNCSRNVWPGYDWLKKEIDSRGPIRDFKVSGSDWNMASNAIHFLAALEYITGSSVEMLELEANTIEIRESKRAGYQEISGVMIGHLKNGTKLELASLREDGVPVTVTVETEDRVYSIAEGPQSVTISPGDITQAFVMLHASQLNETFEEVLMKGTCNLPEYDQSVQLHMRLFEVLAKPIGEMIDGELVFRIT